MNTNPTFWTSGGKDWRGQPGENRAYARVVCDSINPDGVRLTTFEARFWRPVLAEFNTHCVLSRNSASLRAIPLAKMIERVTKGPAEPLVWASEQRGMQGGDEVPMHVAADASQLWYEDAMWSAVEAAKKLGEWGIHKSIANRLLEPFMWHTAVVTATAWENFFDQRCSPLAQPEIREVAELMRQARDASTPHNVGDGDWHLPYVWDDAETCEWAAANTPPGEPGIPAYYTMLAQISAARCARVSYLTQDGRRDPQEDLNLYERLVTARPAHWSPLEHVATPWEANYQRYSEVFGFMDLNEEWVAPQTEHLPRVGKLLQWRSLRTTVESMTKEVTYR
jgi:hypothetical protein